MNGTPNISIELRDVTLRRRVTEAGTTDLKASIFAAIRGQYHRAVRKTVLQDVSLSIRRGEKFGIIGANGSGKSTLLKVICGILRPTSGSAVALGTIAPLLELGAGFDPDLPVVENIILYGVLLGRPRAEMQKRVNAILDFAELREFRAYPVRSLSSGMAARLGFAIATDRAPEILIVDEVLSIGDEHFRHKSRRRIEELWRDEVTVLIVSHELPFVESSCERVAWLDGGRMRHVATSQQTVKEYLASVEETSVNLIAELNARYGNGPSQSKP